MKGIEVSKEHGVNPSIQKCFVCGDDVGIVLFGRLREKGSDGMPVRGTDVEAPKYIQNGVCDRCKDAMKIGVFIIAVKDGETGENPYRTGQLVCIKDEAFRRMFKGVAPKVRFSYMEETLFNKLFSGVMPKEDK